MKKLALQVVGQSVRLRFLMGACQPPHVLAEDMLCSLSGSQLQRNAGNALAWCG